jgi:hypothetical protein
LMYSDVIFSLVVQDDDGGEGAMGTRLAPTPLLCSFV